MSGFKVGDKVLLLGHLLADDGSVFVAPNTVGVVEDVFEDGDLQIRFKNGIPHDAVHWVKPAQIAHFHEQAARADSPPDAGGG